MATTLPLASAPFLCAPSQAPELALLPSHRRGLLLLALGCLPAVVVLLALHTAALARAADGPAPGRPVPVASASGSALQPGRTPALALGVPSSNEVVAQARRSVARISVDGQGGAFAAGSGFYIGDRLVVTTAHLLAGAQRVSVQLDLGTVSASAAFVGWDVAKDVALLRLDLAHAPDVPALAVRPTQRQAAGLAVLALGYPYWNSGPDPSASMGIISRYMETPGLGWTMESDARGGQGSDGGPLLDGSGTVVGMSQGWVGSAAWPAQLAVTSDQIAALLPALQLYGGWRPPEPWSP